MRTNIPIEIERAIEQELERLPRETIKNLRNRWKELFAIDPPKAFGPDLLRRAIAQKIQEQAYGGLNPEAQRELNQLIKLHANKGGNRRDLPRRIKPGAVVLREWKGQTHRVTVLSRGFYYNEQTYLSLSEVARAITGTRWNGPRFFGLRKPEPITATADSAKASRAGGRAPNRSIRTSAAFVQEVKYEA